MQEHEGVALRAIRWSEIFPWLSIGKSFRLAVSPRLIAFGAAALLLTLLAWWTIARVFSHDGVPNDSWKYQFGDRSAWQVIDTAVPDRPFEDFWVPRGQVPAPRESSGLMIRSAKPLLAAWYTFSRPVTQFFSTSPETATPASDVIALVLSALCSLAIWAFFGAAISRVAAVELATGERVGWGASLRWACEKWLAYFSAPAIPMIGVFLAVLPVFLLGWLMRIFSLFTFLGGIVWPLALLAAFAMTLLLVGVLLGWPLMWATISVEGTDSFDALSRTYAYVLQKPLRYLCYIVVAAVVGWLGWIVVENFAAAVIWLAEWAASWGAGPTTMTDLLHGSGDSSLVHGGSSLIGFWNGWVKLFALGYVFSYLGVASTAIYYQMRRDTDARETDEVFLDADKSERNFGLHKLQKDAAGAPELVPVAADGQAKAEDAE